jgi:hypothetical protein
MANKVNGFQVGGDTYGIIPDLTFDNYPTEGSSNPVTSDGIARAVQSATVGTDISVGREAGTPIGYCSIAYGDHVVSTADYSIVFGKRNKSMTALSIMCGIDNISYAGDTNIVMGQKCSVAGYYSSIIGSISQIGSTLITTDSDMYYPKTYIGYLNLTTKKLYYDPEMTDEYPIVFEESNNYGTTYIVDLTDSGTQSPGSIYEYERKRVGRTTRTTITPILNRYAFFTDICRNSLYYYRGTCYYDAAHDKNYRHYSGGSFSDEITDTTSDPIYGGSIYFDLLSSCFVYYCYNIGMTPYQSSHPNWIKVEVYRCAGLTNDYDADIVPRKSYCYQRRGRYAYVYTDIDTNAAKVGKVYSTPTYDDGTEITNQLYDGEMVVDLSNHPDDSTSSGMIYKYRFTKDHVLAYVAPCLEMTPDCGWPFDGSVGTSVSGFNNQSYGGFSYGTIISGFSNKLCYGGTGATIFGSSNVVAVGTSDGNAAHSKRNGTDLSSIIAGVNNVISTRSTYFHTSCIFGDGNNIKLDQSNSNRIFVTGWDNYLTGGGMDAGCFIDGIHNQCHSISNTSVRGRSNNVYYVGESHVTGSYNTVGVIDSRSFVDIKVNKSGIYEGSGVTYDDLNDRYTFDTNKIFRVYGIREEFSRYDDNTTNDCLLKTIYSTNGYDEVNADNINAGDHHVFVYGTFNSYIKRLSAIQAGNKYSSNDNFIIGNSNVMYAWGNKSITLIGKGLLYYRVGPSSPSGQSEYDYDANAVVGTIVVGAYNAVNAYPNGSQTNIDPTFNKAQFVVGIGTSENDRKNGFVVSKEGVAALPSAPDTINAAQALCGWNPQKMIITLGMLRDYAPKTPGAVGKPAVTVLTLTAAGWTGFDQDVTLSDVKVDSVVIAQADGNPYTYNFNNIYLSAQANGTLTFTCTTVPSVDVSVKVVYWT